MLAQLGRRDAAMAALDAALRLLRARRRRPRAPTHLRAALWFRSALCDPTRALHAPSAGSTRSTQAGSTTATLRASCC